MPGNPNTRDDTERWLEDLGTKFVTVWFFTRGRKWVSERHIDDHETFLETVGMSLGRLGGYAMWFDGHNWCLLSRITGDCRTYPSKEAAEMVAIHHG